MTLPPKEVRGLLLSDRRSRPAPARRRCAERLVAEHPDVQRIVTCTTRAPREGERPGVDYHFLSDAEFDAALADDEFLEWAQVHTARYGTKQSAVFNKLAHHIDLVISGRRAGRPRAIRAGIREPTRPCAAGWSRSSSCRRT